MAIPTNRHRDHGVDHGARSLRAPSAVSHLLGPTAAVGDIDEGYKDEWTHD